MPSPFPGMDPFLENPRIFPDFHDTMIAFIKEGIQPKLPAPYYAAIAARVWLEKADRFLGPDVRIHREEGPKPHMHPDNGVVIIQDTMTKPVVFRVPLEEIKETYLQVFQHDKKGEKRLITSIEILSPTNKLLGKRGRTLYLRKQREMLRGGVNLVEIDLLRGGTHATAVPLDWALAKTGGFDYHVSIRRPARAEEYVVYPIPLTASLPTIGVPLLDDDGEVALDLQAIFIKTYDAGNYERQGAYEGRVPDPALTTSQIGWVKKIIMNKSKAKTKKP